MSVVDFSFSETTSLAGKNSPTKLPPELVAQQKVYRNLVLKDLIDSEKAHVAELQGLLKNFLHPLEKSEMWVLILYNYLFISKTVILCMLDLKLIVLIKQFNKMYKPWILCHLLLYKLDGPSNLWFPTVIERDRNCVCVQHLFVANVHVHRTGMQICMYAEMHVGLPVRKSSLVTCNRNEQFCVLLE